MNDYIFLKARAKINITLDVLNKREDGYHNLSMIMQTVHLHDVLTIEKNKSGKIFMTCNLKWLPVDERNLVYKCSIYMKEHYKIKEGFNINLIKNIPVSAGMAGGSSDCAATLVAIRNLFKLSISKNELKKIGKMFGADVPYCINRGTALAEGIGEKITPLKPHPPIFVLIAKPPISISSQEIFTKLDINKITYHPKTDLVINYINEQNINGIANNFHNVLELVTMKENPIIYDLKETMLKNNALGTLMTGSGPSVFGYFNDISSAKSTLNSIKMLHPTVKELFITSIYNPIIKK